MSLSETEEELGHQLQDLKAKIDNGDYEQLVQLCGPLIVTSKSDDDDDQLKLLFQEIQAKARLHQKEFQVVEKDKNKAWSAYAQYRLEQYERVMSITITNKADAVFEGGGVKGIALVGALSVSEHLNVKCYLLTLECVSRRFNQTKIRKEKELKAEIEDDDS